MAPSRTKTSSRPLTPRFCKNNMNMILKWILGIIAAGLFAYGFIILRLGEKELLGQYFPSQGQIHIPVGKTHPAYDSNPPTSGWHYEKPADWGIYQTELPDERLVHNLEHGGIWISYNGIDGETKSKIENFAKQHADKMIVTPRTKNEDMIVLASWTQLLRMDTFDETMAAAFMHANKNQSPEPYAL